MGKDWERNDNALKPSGNRGKTNSAQNIEWFCRSLPFRVFEQCEAAYFRDEKIPISNICFDFTNVKEAL